jgi:hypothetical protein
MGGLEQMLAYRKSREELEKMNDERAMEMMRRKPNMVRPQMFLNTVPAALEGLTKKGGGDAGLRRVVGGRKGAGHGSSPNFYRDSDSDNSGSESDSEDRRLSTRLPENPLRGGAKKGGFLPMLLSAIPAVMSLFGHGKDGILEPRTKGGEFYGKHVGDEIRRMHGAGFLDEFIHGITGLGHAGGGGTGGGGAGGGHAGGHLGIASGYLDGGRKSRAVVKHKASASVGRQHAPNVTHMANISSKSGVAFNPVVPHAIPSQGIQVPNYAPEWFRNSGDIAGGSHHHLHGEGIVEDVMDFVKNKAVPAVKRFFGHKGEKAAPAPAPSQSHKAPPSRSAPMPATMSDAEHLASMGIHSNKDFKKWAVKNHPDKGGDSAKFAHVSSMADRAFSKAGAGRKKVPRKASEATLARRECIRRLMRDKGMTLPQASSHIKQHGMDY